MGKVEFTGVLTASADGVALRVKVVPGASRTRIAGILGDRLKVQVAAPPEGGRANQAVRELIAELFGIGARNVVVEAGHTQPQKTLTLIGVSLCRATETLAHALEAK